MARRPLGAVRDLDVFLLNLSRFQGQIERFPGEEETGLRELDRETPP